MYENGIFQIWHRRSKAGKIYTALVAVDKFGKLQFDFDMTKILLCLNLVKSALIEKGLVCNSIYDIFTTDEEFRYDVENDKFI